MLLHCRVVELHKRFILMISLRLFLTVVFYGCFFGSSGIVALIRELSCHFFFEKRDCTGTAHSEVIVAVVVGQVCVANSKLQARFLFPDLTSVNSAVTQ